MAEIVAATRAYLKGIIKDIQKRLDLQTRVIDEMRQRATVELIDKPNSVYQYDLGVNQGKLESLYSILPDLQRLNNLLEGMKMAPKNAVTNWDLPVPGVSSPAREEHEKKLYELACLHAHVGNLSDYTAQLDRHNAALQGVTETLNDILGAQATIAGRIRQIAEDATHAGRKYGGRSEDGEREAREREAPGENTGRATTSL